MSSSRENTLELAQNNFPQTALSPEERPTVFLQKLRNGVTGLVALSLAACAPADQTDGLPQVNTGFQLGVTDTGVDFDTDSAVPEACEPKVVLGTSEDFGHFVALGEATVISGEFGPQGGNQFHVDLGFQLDCVDPLPVAVSLAIQDGANPLTVSSGNFWALGTEVYCQNEALGRTECTNFRLYFIEPAGDPDPESPNLHENVKLILTSEEISTEVVVDIGDPRLE